MTNETRQPAPPSLEVVDHPGHPFHGVPLIYAYTRAQAIADGVLANLSTVLSIKQHWRHPFACTATVWSIIEAALDTPGQDLCGICHDISSIAKLAVRQQPGVDQILFSALIVGRKHAFKLHIGPGDTAAPVLTLMLPHED